MPLLFPDLVAEIAFNSDPAAAYLRGAFTMAASGDSFLYVDMSGIADYVIQAGDYLEYDVWWEDSLAKIALDFTCSDGTALRSGAVPDQNGYSSHPSTNLDAVALRQWYHRKIWLTDPNYPSLIRKTISFWDLACESDATGALAGRIRDIQITDGYGTIRRDAWRQVQPLPGPLLNHRMAPVGAGSTTFGAVSEGATSVILVSAAAFSAGGGEAVAGGIVFAYTGKSGNTLTGCTRTPGMAGGVTVSVPSSEALALTRPYEAPIFTDVTPYLLEAHPRRGRQKPLERVAGGTMAVTLDNADRRFDPENSDSPYWPNVVDGRRMRVRIRHYWELLKADGAASVWRLNEPAYSPPDTVIVLADSVGNIRGFTSGVTPSAVTLGAAAMLYGDNDETTASFDGGDFITMGDYYRFKAASAFSLAAVISPDAGGIANDGVRRTIISNRRTSGTTQGWSLQILNKKLRVSRVLNGTEQYAEWGTNLVASTIYVVHATYDGSTLRLYVNGALVASAASAQSLLDVAGDVQIGNSALTGEGFIGRISSVGIWGSVSGLGLGGPGDVLTPEAIDSHYDKVSFAVWSNRFDGYIEDWGIDWVSRRPEAQITVSDDFAALQDAVVSGFRDIEYSGARIGWVLDQVNFPGDRRIDPGRSLVEGSASGTNTLLDNDAALEHMLAIAESEVGLFFIGGDGAAVFQDRLRRLLSAAAIQATFTNDPVNAGVDALLAIGITPSKSKEDVLNDIRLRPIAATTDGVAVDLGSQLKHRLRSLARTVWLTSVPECQSQAEWMLAQYRDAKLRFDELRIDYKRDINGLALGALSLEISERISIKYRMPSGQPGNIDTVGPLVTKECHIEAIEDDIVTRDGRWSWETRFALSAAETQAYWILGDAENSLLGQSTILGY